MAAKRNWTTQQAQAISAQDGAILVSAAAGSGKTSVLVERVIARITGKTPCDIDSLLIVTFTKAAASEMRERIGQALREQLAAHPGDANLRRQQMLLDRAKICTIDAFCADVVRENFHQLGLDLDYQMLEESDRRILSESVLDDLLEEEYEAGEPEFLALSAMLSSGREDKALPAAIEKLHGYTSAIAFPQTWLAQMAEQYTDDTPFPDTLWGIILLGRLEELFSYAAGQYRMAIRIASQEEKLLEGYVPQLEAELAQAQTMLESAQARDWDALYTLAGTMTFPTLRAPRGYANVPEKVLSKEYRDQCKKQMEQAKKLLCTDLAGEREDRNALAPLAEKLTDLTIAYDQRLWAEKFKKQAFTFSDIEHLALGLFIEETEAGYVPTDYARTYGEQFTELLVDEYQDTNMVQDLMFSAISRNGENLFLVGDAKQSIYRFRQAMPEIFIGRKAELTEFTGGNYPAYILLRENFRSRPEVTEFVNFLFEQVMSLRTGEIRYDDTEALVPGLPPENSKPDAVELHLVDTAGKEQGQTQDMLEAQYLARLIREKVARGETISDGGTERPVRYSDFCILMRSASTHLPAYVKEFEAAGVPAFAEASGAFFDTAEVSLIVSLLRIIDNPLQDIPLLGVLHSELYGFTPDELADIRMADRRGSLYEALSRHAQAGDEKSRLFLEDLHAYRTLASSLSASAFMRRLYEQTVYLSIVLAMPNGRQRKSNLQRLLTLVETYESAGYIGIAGLVRFLDKVQEQRLDIKGAATLGDSTDMVRFMTIHHSKGLEFPIVVLARCAAQFNTDSQKGRLLLHSKLGAGLKRRNPELLFEYNTLPYLAVQAAIEENDISEELRVLYVALTRAKQKLILAYTAENLPKKLQGLSAGASKAEFHPFEVRAARGFGDWILSCALRHPNASELRVLSGAEEIPVRETPYPLQIVLSDAVQPEELEAMQEDVLPEPDAELLRAVDEKLSYVYPYESLEQIPAKQAVSQLNERMEDVTELVSSRPAFLSDEGFTGAQVGTFTHQFMQYADYEAAMRDLNREADRLVTQHFLTEQERNAIDMKALRKFFDGPLAARICNADRYFREYKFKCFVPAWRYDDSLPAEFRQEKIVVQGIADCLFIENGQIVIVDYKTDRVKHASDLIARYRTQIEIYKDALQAVFEMPVQSCLLYSFYLGREIEVKF